MFPIYFYHLKINFEIGLNHPTEMTLFVDLSNFSNSFVVIKRQTAIFFLFQVVVQVISRSCLPQAIDVLNISLHLYCK